MLFFVFDEQNKEKCSILLYYGVFRLRDSLNKMAVIASLRAFGRCGCVSPRVCILT